MKMIMMTLSVFMMLCVSACSGETESVYENHDSQTAISALENVGVEKTVKSVLAEDI